MVADFCHKLIFPLLSCLFFLPVSGQELAQFKADESIVRGALPCGAEYYLIHNVKDKGYADFALVQKNHFNPEEARKSLLSSGGFSGNPYEFFAKKGVSCGKQGFVSFRDGSTAYHFRKVPCYDSAAADSTLLILFDMMRSCPTEQAIIVSGDIQTQVVAERLRMLSLTIDKLLPAPQTALYQWNPSEELRISDSRNETDSTVVISVGFHAKRIDAEALNSPLPLVSRMFAREIGIILKNRLWESFYQSGIPMTGFSFHYRSSASGLEDELYTLSLKTSLAYAADAVRKVSFELGLLDSKGASAEEYSDARERFLYEIGARKPRDDNNAYVKKCMRHYLYGASLASDKSLYEFFSGRKLPLNIELELFNNFVSALLSPEKTVDLNLSIPTACKQAPELRDAFRKSWNDAVTDTAGVTSPAFRADTTLLVQTKKKVKLKQEKKDVISGGVEWTFSNGMRVIFKKEEGLSRIHCGMLLRGGITGVPSISAGEAGFVTDMSGLFRVAGMNAMEFSSMLSAKGVTLTAEAGMSDFRICATATESELPLLLRALIAFSETRETDREAFGYYKKCEAVALDERRHSIAGIDDIEQNVLFPDFKYKMAKDLSVLRDDLPIRTEIYLRSLFEKANDGIIVIVGNLEPYSLQKLLCRNLGEFKTSDVISVKPKVRDGKKSGWRTRYLASGMNAVKIRTSVKMPYTSESSLAFDVATKVISKKLVSCLAPLGYYAEIQSSTMFYPSESFHLSIVCMPSDENGLPYGISPASSNKVLQAVREALAEAGKQVVPDSEMKACKEECINLYSERRGQPEGIMEAVFTRVSFGKNISPARPVNADAVTGEEVQKIVRNLDRGSRIETVLRKM